MTPAQPRTADLVSRYMMLTKEIMPHIFISFAITIITGLTSTPFKWTYSLAIVSSFGIALTLRFHYRIYVRSGAPTRQN